MPGGPLTPAPVNCSIARSGSSRWSGGPPPGCSTGSVRRICRVDQDYETLRIDMQTLFHDLGITTDAAAA